MNTNRNELALRRRSIRTLTPSELGAVHGGVGQRTGASSGPSTRK
jgi:hypothetical protein